MANKDRLIYLLMQGEIEAEKKGIFNCSRSKYKAEIIADFLHENDVTEVVRCKNCKFFLDDPMLFTFNLISKDYDGLCVLKKFNFNNKQYASIHYDDFCSFAERKE